MKYILTLFALLALAACEPKDPDLTIITQDGKRYGYDVEIAITPEQQVKGMMFRTEMDKHFGMLFWFGGAEEERSFWMKNVVLPLDVLFIDARGKIISIQNGKPNDTTSLLSNGLAAAALEINGGQAEKRGIKPGDTVHFPFFGNAIAPE